MYGQNSISSGLQPKYGSGHWDCKFDPGCKFGKFDPNPNRHCMHKFASLVISGSLPSSVIMQLCNHAGCGGVGRVFKCVRVCGVCMYTVVGGAPERERRGCVACATRACL